MDPQPASGGRRTAALAISFPAARSATPLDGRVLLFISDDGRTEPRTQTDQYRANTTRPIFGVDVDALRPGQDVVIDETIGGWPLRSLEDLPAGEYWVQALINRHETFHRAAGHTVTRTTRGNARRSLGSATRAITCTRRSTRDVSSSDFRDFRVQISD